MLFSMNLVYGHGMPKVTSAKRPAVTSTCQSDGGEKRNLQILVFEETLVKMFPWCVSPCTYNHASFDNDTVILLPEEWGREL